ncbi:MAG: DMT family transporter, partial [Planctomycetota bacterium]
WGVYSLLGRGVRDPVAAIGSSFVRGTLLALPICALLLLREPARLETNGILLAVTSGAVTSGLGYVLWYSVLPHLGTTRASVLQLAVPVIAAAAGALFLQEPVTLRLVAASATIIGGIAIVIATRSQSRG